MMMARTPDRLAQNFQCSARLAHHGLLARFYLSGFRAEARFLYMQPCNASAGAGESEDG